MQSRADINRIAEIEEGIPLWGCIPDSPAARAGLRYGDIILEINGVQTRSLSDYRRATGEKAARMKVVYLRDGERRETTLSMKDRVAPSLAEAARFIVKQRLMPADPLDERLEPLN